MDSSMFLAALHGDTALYANFPETNDMGTSVTTTTVPKITSTIKEVTIAPLDTITSAITTLMSTATTTTTTTTMATSTIEPEHDTTISMNNFYPALVQCFGIIICG
uniref:Uncharacterized protein n=1 Tax=Glossina brevipalpis TaxID=37001 RepID=A0A1A9WP20_9MUSC